jgi:hypothetical protein
MPYCRRPAADPEKSGQKTRQLEPLAVVLAVDGIAVVQARQVLADAEAPLLRSHR